MTPYLFCVLFRHLIGFIMADFFPWQEFYRKALTVLKERLKWYIPIYIGRSSVPSFAEWDLTKQKISVFLKTIINFWIKKVLNITSKRYIEIILEFLIMILSHYNDISNKFPFPKPRLSASYRKLLFNAWKM